MVEDEANARKLDWEPQPADTGETPVPTWVSRYNAVCEC